MKTTKFLRDYQYKQVRSKYKIVNWFAQYYWYHNNYNPLRLFLFPKYIYDRIGIVVNKEVTYLIPFVTICLWKIGHISYERFHSGIGFSFNFSPLFRIEICIDGKIGYWYKYGILSIVVLRKEIVKF